MDSSVHAMIIAQHSHDRMAEATSARRAREAKLTQERAPKLRRVRRWLRASPKPATHGTITAVPPA